MKYGTRIFLCVVIMGSVAGCASRSADVAPAYVSSMQYEGYSCKQLYQESQQVSAYAAQAAGQQDNNRTSDAVMTGIAAVVFWPAMFAIKGDNAQTAELAQLKGRIQAIEQASIRENCGFRFHQQGQTVTAIN